MKKSRLKKKQNKAGVKVKKQRGKKIQQNEMCTMKTRCLRGTNQ